MIFFDYLQLCQNPKLTRRSQREHEGQISGQKEIANRQPAIENLDGVSFLA
jgi:hypothetical protein